MKVRSFAKYGIGLSCAALIASSAVIPAHADPASGTYGTLVGLGSDTTQSVLNGLSTDIPGNLIASYDATGASATVITRSSGATVPRANGSGAGRDLLRTAIGQSPNVSGTTFGGTAYSVETKDVAGGLDFARSSSGPTTTVADGVLTYIPFAKDAVSYATSANSYIPSNLTQTQLTNIYTGQVKWVSPTGDLAATQVNNTYVRITTFLPQSGSGTRSFWISKVGLTEGTITTNNQADASLDTALDFAGNKVQENDGTALSSGTVDQNRGAIVPFSASQWVSQANGAQPDVRHGAVVNSIEGTAPTTGSGTSYVLNSSFTSLFSRLVYNIVATRDAEDDSSDVAKAFVGTSSLVCSATSTITRYGFGLLTATTGDQACGDTSRTAYDPSSSSLDSFTVPASASAGAAVTLSATVGATNGTQGGTVNFYNGSIATANLIASATVPAGSTTGSVSYTPTTPGSYSIVADFVPTLAGVAYATNTTAQTLTVAAQTSTTAITSAAASTYGKAAVVKVKVTGSAGTPTGKVNLKEGSTVIGSATLSNGIATVTLSKTLAAGKHTLTASYLGSTSTGASTSSAATLTIAKAKTTVKVAKVATVKYGKQPVVTITVTSATGATVTGTAVIKEGSKTLVKKVTITKGKATVKLSKKTTAKKHTITVSFTAGTNFSASSAKATVTVKKK